MKHEIQTAIDDDKMNKDVQYQKEYSAYSTKRNEAMNKLQIYVNAKYEDVKKLKIVIPDSLKPIYEEVSKWDEPVSIAILPDHPTPCAIKTHTASAIPFIIYNPEAEADKVEVYNEFSVKEGSYGILNEDEFIKSFLKK
jgi:2,3-bisphosphoglycerate-independent phosphoglycerate mutase